MYPIVALSTEPHAEDVLGSNVPWIVRVPPTLVTLAVYSMRPASPPGWNAIGRTFGCGCASN